MFLAGFLKSTNNKRNSTLDFIKIKNFCLSKVTIKKVNEVFFFFVLQDGRLDAFSTPSHLEIAKQSIKINPVSFNSRKKMEIHQKYIDTPNPREENINKQPTMAASG